MQGSNKSHTGVTQGQAVVKQESYKGHIGVTRGHALGSNNSHTGVTQESYRGHTGVMPSGQTNNSHSWLVVVLVVASSSSNRRLLLLYGMLKDGPLRDSKGNKSHLHKNTITKIDRWTFRCFKRKKMPLTHLINKHWTTYGNNVLVWMRNRKNARKIVCCQ